MISIETFSSHTFSLSLLLLNAIDTDTEIGIFAVFELAGICDYFNQSLISIHLDWQITNSMLMNASFIYPENTATTKEAY